MNEPRIVIHGLQEVSLLNSWLYNYVEDVAVLVSSDFERQLSLFVSQGENIDHLVSITLIDPKGSFLKQGPLTFESVLVSTDSNWATIKTTIKKYDELLEQCEMSIKLDS